MHAPRAAALCDRWDLGPRTWKKDLGAVIRPGVPKILQTIALNFARSLQVYTNLITADIRRL